MDNCCFIGLSVGGSSGLQEPLDTDAFRIMGKTEMFPFLAKVKIKKDCCSEVQSLCVLSNESNLHFIWRLCSQSLDKDFHYLMQKKGKTVPFAHSNLSRRHL